MSTSLFKNAVITFATGSSALIFCSYMYQDGFFSSFGIRIERYLDGLPERRGEAVSSVLAKYDGEAFTMDAAERAVERSQDTDWSSPVKVDTEKSRVSG